jgi:hypothetical protein
MVSAFYYCLQFFIGRYGRSSRLQRGPPANVAGKWTLYCKDPNGSTSSKYLELEQDGTSIKGHFKGPNQSAGVEGTINEQHLVVRTKTACFASPTFPNRSPR